MGLFDDVLTRDPRFACSEGHDLNGEPFQSTDFGCTMGTVFIGDGYVAMTPGRYGDPECNPFPREIHLYRACTQCPAFVQYGTGNLVPTACGFVVRTDGKKVLSIERVGESTAEFLENEPKRECMAKCEGPMSYDDAMERHVHYPRDTPEIVAWREECNRRWLAEQEP